MEREPVYTKHYFTFGIGHRLPDGRPGMDEYVVVSASENHRGLFLGWLGSTAWSGEYTEQEWNDRSDPVSRHYSGPAYASITVRQQTPFL